MQHMKVYQVKFLGPTNFRGSRIKITDGRTGKSVTLNRNYSYNSIMDQAIDYLKEQGVNVVGSAHTDKMDILLSDNFNKGIGLINE